MPWYITVLTSVGTSVLTCLGMEAYHQHRAQDRVGDYDYPDER